MAIDTNSRGHGGGFPHTYVLQESSRFAAHLAATEHLPSLRGLNIGVVSDPKDIVPSELFHTGQKWPTSMNPICEQDHGFAARPQAGDRCQQLPSRISPRRISCIQETATWQHDCIRHSSNLEEIKIALMGGFVHG